MSITVSRVNQFGHLLCVVLHGLFYGPCAGRCACWSVEMLEGLFTTEDTAGQRPESNHSREKRLKENGDIEQVKRITDTFRFLMWIYAFERISR